MFLSKRSSPRSWRCFFRKLAEMGKSDVFSTLVEVFRSQSSQKVSESGLLHARGGVSTAATHSSSKIESSPRSWRCFSSDRKYHDLAVVFSTLVEVFLAPAITKVE